MSASAAAKAISNMVIQTHKTVQCFRAIRRQIPQGMKIGFVPTMGALHEGKGRKDRVFFFCKPLTPMKYSHLFFCQYINVHSLYHATIKFHGTRTLIINRSCQEKQ